MHAYRPWSQLRGGSPHIAALQAVSVDLLMASGVEEADVVHSHTWYAQFGGHLAKLIHDMPHVATVHSLEPLRPWKAEQLGGGYALSSFCERVALRGRRRALSPSRRARSATSWTATRPSTERRVHVVYNGIDTAQYAPDPGDRRAGSPRRRPRAAERGVRRAHHSPEGGAAAAARGAAVRPGRSARSLRRRAGHARDRGRGEPTASAAPAGRSATASSGSRRCCPSAK